MSYFSHFLNKRGFDESTLEPNIVKHHSNYQIVILAFYDNDTI